ncbi:hypothetical protein BDV96DRAFT_644121 [Lophiotrema nucula]|uniref:Uncharacterized protein n=1 Tax=Lophiotrema nucula TaxID=690887 RepID=A0A6A5ZE95_9PLEO|nr:hypothetical protein BDV96DRAFT_644121 [Lophiotrema nucula]
METTDGSDTDLSGPPSDRELSIMAQNIDGDLDDEESEEKNYDEEEDAGEDPGRVPGEKVNETTIVTELGWSRDYNKDINKFMKSELKAKGMLGIMSFSTQKERDTNDKIVDEVVDATITEKNIERSDKMTAARFRHLLCKKVRIQNGNKKNLDIKAENKKKQKSISPNETTFKVSLRGEGNRSIDFTASQISNTNVPDNAPKYSQTDLDYAQFKQLAEEGLGVKIGVLKARVRPSGLYSEYTIAAKGTVSLRSWGDTRGRRRRGAVVSFSPS